MRGRSNRSERRSLLLDQAVLQQHDAVGQRHRLDLVVGDVDHGLAELLVQTLDLAAHLVAQLGVEVGERLVEQEQAGVAHDRAADRDALALAARELARQALEQARDVEHLCGALHPAVDLVLRKFARAQAERDVLEHVHVRVERVVLEHHGDVAIARPHVVDHLAVDRDRAVVDLLEARDRAQERALAAAGRAHQHRELALGDVEVDAAHGVGLAIELVQAGDLQSRHRAVPAHPASPLTAPSEMPRTR